MEPLVNELVQYLIKFFAMLICAFGGICVGKAIRKSKNEEKASEKAVEKTAE